MRKSAFSLTGLIMSALALFTAVCGGRLAAIVYDDPPRPLLEHAEGRAITSGDVANAVVDKAADLKDELKERTRDLALRGYRSGRRLLDRYLEPEEKAPAPDIGESSGVEDAHEASTSATARVEPPARPGFRERFRINLSSLSDRQKSLLRIFHDFSLFGGFAGLLAGVAGWIRREDGRMAACGIVLGAAAALWANVVLTLTWLLESPL